MAQIGEHGFDNAESARVARSSDGAVDPAFHAIGGGFFSVDVFALEEHDLARLVDLGFAQALSSQWARAAVPQGAAELDAREPAYDDIAAIAIE